MKISRVFLIAGLFLMLGGVAKAAPGWYGGASVGQSSIDLTTRDWDDGTLTNTQLDKSSIGYKVIAGYRFTRLVSLEGAYMHFGKDKFGGIKPASTVPSIWKSGRVSGETRVKGVSLEAVLGWPFFKDRLAVFGRGGMFFWNSTKKSRPTIAGGTLALGDELVEHDDGVSWIFGVGTEMRVYDKWHIRLEWEHTMVGFSGTVDRNVDFPSLGVTLDL